MMELKGKHFVVAALVGGAALGLSFGLADQVRQSGTAAHSAAGPASLSSTAMPEAGDLGRVVAAILSPDATGSAREAGMPLSPAFIADKVMFGRFLEVAGATGVRSRVVGVRGRDADLVISYALVSDAKVKLNFTRRDTWTFTHGDAGWLLDGIRVNDKAFTGLVYPGGSRGGRG